MPTNPTGIVVMVTQKHIDGGKRKSSSHCMIAEAIKEQITDARQVSVDLQTIRYSQPYQSRRVFYLTPRKAQQGIIAFDQGDKELKPFTFTLRAPHYTPVSSNPGQKAKTQGVTFTPTRNDNTQIIKTKQGGKGAELTSTEDKRGWPAVKIGRRREFGLRALSK